MTMNKVLNEIKLRVDWSELDYFGHVNNVAFFKYIQSSRVCFFDRVGLTISHKETNIGPILASCNCDFKKPLFYPGTVSVLSRIGFIKDTSFSLNHILINENEDVVAEAQDIIVLYDFNKNEKVSIPNSLKESFQNLMD